MKGKAFVSLTITIILLLATIGAANADISFLTTDGIWGRIDDGFYGIPIDIVGVIGQNPSAGYWGTGVKRTQDRTLIRSAANCTIDPIGDANLTDWTGISPAVYTNLGSHTMTNSYNQCLRYGFFISEYIEGVGAGINVDAIELYNNMGLDWNFSVMPFWIQIFNDGSPTPSVIIPLTTGVVQAGTTFVIAAADITGVTENLITSALVFDGNDAVALVRDYSADVGGDGDDGAYQNIWATGPSGNTPIGTVGSSGADPSFQSPPSTDWNQVRYGLGTDGTFATQSGLAFHGTNNSDVAYGDQKPFFVGKFCHVNHPITIGDNNQLNNVPLRLDLTNIGCGVSAIQPFPPVLLSFVYPVNLDETTNSGICRYPSTSPCADAVTFGQTHTSFYCNYPGSVRNTYTVALLGFMHLPNADADCSSVPFNAAASDGTFISQEGTTNCGCLYAMITEGSVTAVSLYSFEGVGSAAGVNLTWETADETDNLGFNVYRADSLITERVQLNASLIPTNVPPGSPFGALYSFEDPSAEGFQTYFYWLEDVDVNGTTTLHGPVMVEK